ncbi:polysaccharide biosynthesis tyrosine autokinase [Nocardioides litoris]|uniref:polysaccharide biosynthesis tyrosine autokinase n=1 Tax=Nocardioides litoris TaxID=1926648 RepID=UPI0011213640|nr:polysaccharide biosynthesis tyrosine autokinase [Nocardioides litoris]
MDLSFILRALAARWKGVVLIILLGVGATVGFTLQQPKIYQANADGFVSTDTAQNAPEASINDSLAKSRAPSYVTIATSRATAEKAAQDLGLDVDPSSLIGNITVEQPEGTVLIRILARSTSPQEAQRLADAWVRALAAQVEQVESPESRTSPIQIVPIEAAALPGAPISPNVRNNVAVGTVLSLMLAVAYALLLARLDRRIRLASEVEKRFSTAVMGTVPAFAGETKERSIVIDSALETGSGWSASEAFRRLRTNVAYMDVDNPPRVILVTSPNAAEGKSTVAMNLAAAIAASGQDVVLVDADLRRPTAASSLGLDDAVGLTSVLINQVELPDALQQHPRYETLVVLAAGSVPPNPSELLASNAMGGVVRELALKRVVVIDAPPVLPVTDASVLTRHADGALVVVTYGRTVDAELNETLSQIQAVQGRVLGVVLNRVPKVGNKYYNRGYYTSRSDDGSTKVKAARKSKRAKGRRRG